MGPVSEELRRVGTGLRLVFLGLVVVILNAVAAIAVAVAFLRPGRDPSAMISAISRDHPTAVMVLLGLWVLSNVLAITGKVYCLSIPATSGATPMILMAVACSGIGLALNVVGQSAELGTAVAEFAGTSPVFTIAGYLFFVRFLRRLALFLGSTRLMARTRMLQVGSVGLMVVYLVAALGHSSGIFGAATVLVALMLAVGGLILFGLYLLLIHEIRRTTEGAAEYMVGREDGTG